MLQRFTERARTLIFQAQEEAARLDSDYVSTEHLLLAIARDTSSVAWRILDRMGRSSSQIIAEVERHIERGAGRSGQDMQLSPRAKRVIDLAYDEARQLSHNYIGTEHLLIGLIREGEGVAGRVLSNLGVELEFTRGVMAALLENDAGTSPPSAPSSSSAPAAAGIASSSATLLFEHNYRKLPPEQQAILRTDGLLLSELPPALYITLKVMAQSEHAPESVVLAPNARLRVQSIETEGKPCYTVQTDIALIATLLVRDE